jgi:hypothetical protein
VITATVSAQAPEMLRVNSDAANLITVFIELLPITIGAL